MTKPSAARAVSSAATGWLIAGLPGIALGLAGGAAHGWWRGRTEAGRDERAAADELPDALRAMASAVRAGLSLLQAFAVARDATAGPLRGALDAAVGRLSVGGTLDEAVEGFVKACPREARDLLRLSLTAGRAAGGELGRVLDGAADALAERARVAAERSAATSQARASAAVVAALPLAFFALVGSRSADVVSILFTTPAGLVMLVAGLGLEAAGVLWMRRLLEGA